MKKRGSSDVYEAKKEHINKYKLAHMIGVAEYMRERAESYGLNADVMYTVGLLHDIGYLNGRTDHEQYGATILSAIGIDEDIHFAIAHHGEDAYKVREIFGDKKITPEYVLMLEADMSVNARGFRVGFEGRTADIKHRYGEDHIAYETVQDNVRFIKEYQSEHGIEKPLKLYHKNKPEDLERG